jgi:hypothetical protein
MAALRTTRHKVKNCDADILFAQYMVIDSGLLPQYGPLSKLNHTFCRHVLMVDFFLIQRQDHGI